MLRSIYLSLLVLVLSNPLHATVVSLTPPENSSFFNNPAEWGRLDEFLQAFIASCGKSGEESTDNDRNPYSFKETLWPCDWQSSFLCKKSRFVWGVDQELQVEAKTERFKGTLTFGRFSILCETPESSGELLKSFDDLQECFKAINTLKFKASHSDLLSSEEEVTEEEEVERVEPGVRFQLGGCVKYDDGKFSNIDANLGISVRLEGGTTYHLVFKADDFDVDDRM